MKIFSPIHVLPLAACALGCCTAVQAQGTVALPNSAPAGTTLNSPQITIRNADQVATDDLGRTLPGYAEVGAPKPNRWVGLFYWQWHGDDRWLPNGQYDMSKYLQSRPYFKDFTSTPPGGPNVPTFYWGEPLFGYYRSTDRWVIRKHLMMLADAGVDFLFLDYTNGSLYDEELQAFLDVARELKNAGTNVPRLSFFLNSEPEWKIYDLYNKWYKPGLYDDMWFRWQGKPLLMSPRIEDASKLRPGQDAAQVAAIQDYFTWRPTWAFHDAAKEPTKWRFIHGFNAPVANDAEGKPEQIVVNKSTGGPIWENFAQGGVSAVEGKSYTDKDYAPDWTLPDAGRGVFFQNAWNRALQVAPPMLLVTGWNEWKASVWNTPGVVMLGRKTVDGQGHIVDEFNPQFNRDLEPAKGSYGDNYYWQFVSNMRRYKGMEAPQPPSPARTMKIDGRFEKWRTVTPEFRDSALDIAPRDAPASVPNVHYTNLSARNDIVACKTTSDKSNVYFYVRTASTLSPHTDPNWMLLLIDADQNPKTGWMGYDFVINLSGVKDRTTTIARNVGGRYQWSTLRTIPYRVQGRELELAVPRRILGLSQGAPHFDFKWADNIPSQPGIMDFYSQGDVAPNSRFNYRAELAAPTR